MNFNYFSFKWNLSLALLLFMTQFMNAQLSVDLPLQTDDPKNQNFLSTEVPVTTPPAIDLKPYLEEDLKNDEADKPWRFAVSIPVNLTLENSGKWDELPNGDRIWRLQIKSNGAVSTNLLYKEFFLPKRATLHIYKPDKSQIRGAFTAANNKKDRVFATALLLGESVVLEYYEPKSVKGEGVIHIGTFNHGYRGYGENNTATGNSGNCMSDVNCSNNTTWQTIKRAVGKWSRNGNTWCTGTLMNNTNEDCRPLFLTANHCMDGRTSLNYDAVNNSGPFNTAIFYWNFETPGCNLGEQGDDSQTTNGIERVLANPDLDGNYSSSSDFALFELNENPKSAYDVYFAGWDASGNTGTGGAGIHHPAGDVKKISIHSLTPASAVSDRYWRINPWDQVSGNRSVTEGGSSGSALFRTNGRVIGQLFGSFTGINPNCSDPINDTGDYGKLSYSWTNNGASDSRRRLNELLDPKDGGATTVMSGSANPCNVPPNVGCINALNINCGGSRTVNTMNATNDGNPGPGTCGVALLPDQKGVWYEFTGNGEQVTVSTCNDGTDFDTKLSVFSGSCTSLACIAGNDDAAGCDLKSTVEFVSSPGVTYYIFLSGFGGATGNAEVSITCCDLPVAICKNISVQLDAAGSDISITAADVNNGSTAECGLASETVTPNLLTCMNLGANAVTYEIIDVNGNVSSCTATVTVQDKIKPSIICPPNLTIQCDEDSTPINTGSPTGTDNCDQNLTFTFSDVTDLNGCGSTGTITRTWTATDTSGNFSTCVQIITVVDTTPPNAICQDITVQLGMNEEVTITAAQIDNGSNDACGNVSLEIDVSSFSCYVLGDHTVTLTVTDECGNENSCTATVTLEGPDEDCDTVADICDECPGGDDTIDNNGDGLPDCAYYPGFDNLIEAWKCGKLNNKVLVCHRPQGNTGSAQTICIGQGAVAAHLAHGDYLGPCNDANCVSKQAIPSKPLTDKGSNMQMEVAPNPVNDETTISISLPKGSYAEIEIYNFIGQRVYQIHSGIIDSPMRQFKWNGASEDGSLLPSGVYFIVLKSNSQWITKKLILK